MILDLTPDELLSTTRCVRRRLDLERPVEREVLEDCLRLAQQAPTASYREDWHFVVVTDAEKRAALGDPWQDGPPPSLGAVDPPAAKALPPARPPMAEWVLPPAAPPPQRHVTVIPSLDGP